MDIKHKGRIALEVQELLKAELYDSAEKLCSIFLSYLGNLNYQQFPGSDYLYVTYAEFYELLGDTLFSKEEYRRALAQYTNAIQQRRCNQAFRFRSQSSITSADEAQLRYKECKCLFKLNEVSTATKELEAVPTKLRTLPIWSMLGKLYKTSNLRRHAIDCYKNALSIMPSAVEIIQELIALGVEGSELVKVIEDTDSDSGIEGGYSHLWQRDLVLALAAKRNSEYEKSFEQLEQLAVRFPRNQFILTLTAQVCAESEDRHEQAMACYRQVRRLDSHILEGMDTFGYMLYEREDFGELSRLVSDVLEANPRKATGWLLAALYSAGKEDTDAAMEFIEKAIQLEPRYGASYLLKGQLLASQEQYEQALIAYSQANSFDKDITSFAGLVQINLQLGKNKDAATAAREAVNFLSRNHEAYLLVGKVLLKRATSSTAPTSATTTGEALRMFAKALKLNPRSKDAASSMAEVLVAQDKNDEAIECLTAVLRRVSCAKILLQLGRILASVGRYDEALERMHMSISLNPRSGAEIQQEIEGIESSLRRDNYEQNEEEQEGEEEEEEDCEDSNELSGAAEGLDAMEHDHNFAESGYSYDDAGSMEQIDHDPNQFTP